ncbi:MAG: thioredoxin [Candidatus Levyibacteriota bacterium]|jgi:thioredoxin 1
MADLTLTDQNFKAEVLESKVPVLVDFWAQWCQPCRIVGPIVEELAAEYAGKLKVGKVNVDQNQVPGNYGIMSIPTLLIFQNGQVVKSMVGAQSKNNFKREIDSVLGN